MYLTGACNYRGMRNLEKEVESFSIPCSKRVWKQDSFHISFGSRNELLASSQDRGHLKCVAVKNLLLKGKHRPLPMPALTSFWGLPREGQGSAGQWPRVVTTLSDASGHDIKSFGIEELKSNLDIFVPLTKREMGRGGWDREGGSKNAFGSPAMKELQEAANKLRRVRCSSWRADNCFLIYPSKHPWGLFVSTGGRLSLCKSFCGVRKPSERQPQEPCSLPWDQLGSLGQLPTHIRQRSRSLQNPEQDHAAQTLSPPAGSRGWQCSYSGRE